MKTSSKNCENHTSSRQFRESRRYAEVFIYENLWNGRSFEQIVLQRGTKKKCQPTWFNLALPRAVSKPMKLSDNVISKARLYIGPIAVQRRYFPPDARALNMLFQAAQPVLV